MATRLRQEAPARQAAEPDAARWFAIHTESQAETLATYHLRRQGYEILYLRYPQEIRHARKTRLAWRPLFPRYLFAQVAGSQPIGPIHRTIGVSSIVSAAQEPLEVPSPIIDELQARADRDGLLAPLPARSRPLLAAGEVVTIANGPFAGFSGSVILDDGTRIRISLRWLGRQIEASIEPDAVTVASPALRRAP